MKAIKNRIFLKKDEQSEKIGSIYIPKTEGQYAPPYSGTIIAIGDGIKDSDLKVGVKVFFHDLAGVEFELNGEKIFSIREKDITAIIS